MALALEVIQPSPAQVGCDCRFASCRFTVARVRFYLVAYRQSQILRVPPEEVLRDNCRESRTIDPSIRGGSFDGNTARDIILSLELARDRHGISLNPWNAERIATALCPGRSLETTD